MRIQSFLLRAGAVSLLAGMLAAGNLHAGVPTDGASMVAAPGEFTNLAALDRMPTVDALRLAYEVLGPGKRNYLRHRGTAMAEIELAAKALGAEIGRKIQRAHDDQPKSDARIQLAQRMLERVRIRLTTEDQPAVVEHVDKAITELVKALKIRAIQDEKV